MVPEEWPIAEPAASRWAEPARRAGRSRLATVRRDFFLDPAQRLTEQERALMTAMLDGLVTEAADELRAEVPGTAANDDNGASLATELSGSGQLDIPALIELLLRRAELIHFSSAIRPHGQRREGGLLQVLLSDDSAPVAASAMALILARGRRLDQFGQCRLEFDDLPTAAVDPFVHAIAAALARGNPDLELPLARAATALIRRHRPERSLDTLGDQLAGELAASGKLDDDWLLAAAEEAEGALLGHGLARRAGISSDDAFEALLAGDGDELMLLFRAADVSRDHAARLLASLCDVLGIDSPALALARFDGFGAAELDRARGRMALPRSYRDALAAVGGNHGQRAV